MNHALELLYGIKTAEETYLAKYKELLPFIKNKKARAIIGKIIKDEEKHLRNAEEMISLVS